METIFYYKETGEIISKKELNAIMQGFAYPRGSIGIINKNQKIDINNGKITNTEIVNNDASIIPPENVLDVFTDIVNRHNAQVKSGKEKATEVRKDELDKIIKEYSIKTTGKYVSSKEEYHEKVMTDDDKLTMQRQNEISKILKRRKTLKKIPLALVIGAMGVISATGIKYAKNFNAIADDTNDILNSHHCYINNEVEGNVKVAINDNNTLYGSVNPNYENITQNTYNELKEVLISEGYTDKEATICISSIIPTHLIKDISTTNATFQEKVDFVLNYENEINLSK